MVDNTAGTAETVQKQPQTDPNVSVPFPLEEVETEGGAAGVASEDDSQAPNTETAEGELDAKAEGEADGGEDGDSSAENEETERKRNKVDAKTRIKQLSDKAKAADARADQAEARQRTIEAQLEKLAQRERPGEAVDYDSDAAYTQALISDAVAEAKAENLAELRKEAALERETAKREAWIEKTASLRETATDFDAVITNPAVAITPLMREAIISDPHGPEVAYWLGKNPEEADRIARLNPLGQAREIGRLAERLSAVPQAKKVTQATPPRKTLRGDGSPPTAKPEKMSHEEYRAWRQKVQTAKTTNRR